MGGKVFVCTRIRARPLGVRRGGLARQHLASCTAIRVPGAVQARRKYEEERCELSLRLTLAEAKVQQMQALQAELATAREECAALMVRTYLLTSVV